MALVNLTSSNFNAEVINSTIPVLVDFWAPWCGPCRMVGPVVEEIAKELDGTVKVGKINVDEQGELAQKFGVMSIPTLIVFKDGKIYKTSVGSKPKQALLDMLK